jgi:hypothetical protein
MPSSLHFPLLDGSSCRAGGWTPKAHRVNAFDGDIQAPSIPMYATRLPPALGHTGIEELSDVT